MKKYCVAMGLAGMVAATAAWGATTFQLSNKVGFGYDDNMYLVEKDTDDTFRILESIDANLSVVLERTYLSLRYQPLLTWYEARENDETDMLHNLTFNLLQELAPNLKLDLSDALRAGNYPELYNDNGYVVRQDNDNYFNTARASLMWQMRPTTRLDLSGRYMTLSYSDDDADSHRYDDYDSWVAGLTLRQTLANQTVGLIDTRYQQLNYAHKGPNFTRDAEMFFGGLGVEHTFSREVIGSLRAGAELRTYEDDKNYDDQTRPYVEASLTVMPVNTTRFTLTGSYSISESDITQYLSQERTYVSFAAAHDFNQRLSGYISASWAHGDYDGEYSQSRTADDVSEDAYTFGARVSWRVHEQHWIELNYNFMKLDSDSTARTSYDDNRVDLSWKWQILNLR